MDLRRIALSVLITITLVSGLSFAEDTNVSINDSEIGTTEVVEPTEPATPEVETAAATTDAATSSEAQSLEGSWILNVDDAQISMVIYQSDDLLFGAANSENPTPWNAVVSGLTHEDYVELEMFSLQDGALVSTLITGTALEDTIKGSFVQSDSNGKVNKGSVMGFLTSPDTSGYEPADVPAAATATVAAAVTPAPESSTTETTVETTEDGRIEPVDVTLYKDQYSYNPFPV